MANTEASFSLSGIRHPDYLYDALNWERYRDIYEGGLHFRDHYLQKFSVSETDKAFRTRKSITPIPAFAKQALNEVRNSIYQRLADVTRSGGSEGYQRAMRWDVDRKGNGMDNFMGVRALTELLVIGKVGIYVDAPNLLPNNLQEQAATPYLYYYPAEDILSWQEEEDENLGQFKAVLLRDRTLAYDTHVGNIKLPSGEREERFRLVYRDEVDGLIKVKMFDSEENIVFLEGSEPDGAVVLEGMPVVPFVMGDIGDSLLKDVWSYQVALLNLVSGSVNFDLSSNVPFLTIQSDLRTVGAHLKRPNASEGPESDNQVSADKIEDVGSNYGRYYDKDMDRPDFIAPPSEPLLASLKLQEKMEDDIRKLVNLAVEGKAGSRTESGEAKKLSSQGLESGLSFIGTVLETVEQQIAVIWAHYENTRSPQIAVIGYPARYSLKTDDERLDEAEKLLDRADKIPSKTAKRSIYKRVATLLLEDKVSPETLATIHSEIDAARYTRTDLDFIVESRKEGLVSDETASEALGFAKGEVEQAKEDHTDRLERILKSQSSFQGQPIENAAARGAPDLDPGGNRSEIDQENRNSSSDDE